MLPPAVLDTSPTTVGPREQPTSPPRASSAAMAVPPLGIRAQDRLKVPGHRIPTDSPHRPQPISAITGALDHTASRYPAMHRKPLPTIKGISGICRENLAYTALEVPMSSANRHGPKRSPMVLPTCRADSAKAEAHWLMACSEAPEHTISSTNSQNTPLPASCRMLMPLSSPVILRMGTLAK